MTTEFSGYFLAGNDGDSFEHVVHNGFMKAKNHIWFTSAKTTDFMIPNPRTKEAMQFSQRLYQLARRGIKIKEMININGSRFRINLPPIVYNISRN